MLALPVGLGGDSDNSEHEYYFSSLSGVLGLPTAVMEMCSVLKSIEKIEFFI